MRIKKTLVGDIVKEATFPQDGATTVRDTATPHLPSKQAYNAGHELTPEDNYSNRHSYQIDTTIIVFSCKAPKFALSVSLFLLNF